MPEDPLLARAVAVLAKAESTTFEEERSALVYGGYVLLARYLAAHPAPPGPDGRRRERRLVSDRRRGTTRATERAIPDPGDRYRAATPSSDAGPGGLLDAVI